VAGQNESLDVTACLAVIDSIPQGAIFVFDRDLRHVFAGGPGLADLGLRRESVEGRPLSELVPCPDLLVPLERRYREALAGRGSRSDLKFNDRTYLTDISSAVESDGQIRFGVMRVRDVTEVRADQQALRESEQRFQLAFAKAPTGMALIAPDGRILQANAAMCQFTGYSPAQITTLTIPDLIDPDDLAEEVDHRRRLLEGTIETYQYDKRFRTAAGHRVWGLMSVSLVRLDNGRPGLFIVQVQDISERVKSHRELVRLAERDPLTDVLNRRRFDEELVRHQAMADRYGVQSAILAIDLDELKRINDHFGHDAGDVFIKRVASVISNRVRASDLVSRYGGDEFAVLLPQTKGESALALADDLVRAVNDPAQPGTISIGVAMIGPGQERKAWSRADAAMYRAKRLGGNQAAEAPEERDPPRG